MDSTPLDEIYLNHYFHLIGIIILFYDHILTFPDEYWYIWRKSQSGASCVFLLNRYFALISNIVMTAGNFWIFPTVEHYSTYRLCSLIMTQVFVGVIQILRTYALYRRDWRTLALMIAVAAGVAGGAIFVAIGPTPGVTLNGGCTITSPRDIAIRYAAAWEALFIWDSFIFALTIIKTYRQRFRYTAVVGGNSLLSLIVRDGAVYFAVMACAQCVNSLTYYFLPPALIGVLSTFANGISVTMTSRLMLNLHRKAASVPDLTITEEDNIAQSTKMVFRVDRLANEYHHTEAESSTVSSGLESRGTVGGRTTTEEHELSVMR